MPGTAARVHVIVVSLVLLVAAYVNKLLLVALAVKLLFNAGTGFGAAAAGLDATL